MSKGNKPAKTVEERFQVIDPLEHVLLRPDMYIGSVKENNASMWIYEDGKMVYKDITFVPGFYKMFDEILVNAADQKTRCKTMNMIKVTIDKDSGKISVWNNGDGIPVEIHKEKKQYVPSILFGELRSGENFDDGGSEKRTTGGKNGLGGKLANIYSVDFVVETCDGANNFKQKFYDNMHKNDDPVVTKAKKAGYTKITFTPDFKRFGIKGFNDDTYALFHKRVYDVAMTTGVKVYFNDEAITPLPFQKYIDLYFPEDSEHKKVTDMTSNPRWRICTVFDPSDNMDHQNISFVNSICTYNGGTHVSHVADQIVAKLKVAVEKKTKGLTVKASQIKENLIFFVDSVIEEPEFDGQTKEALKSKPVDFGSKYAVTDAYIKKIVETGVVDQIIENARARAEANIAKKDGTKKGAIRLEKLFDAHQAGKKDAALCTLMLTEGDSAKAFAMAGFNETGRDHFGVFPLKGKLKNVRKGKGDTADIPIDALEENKEIKAIREIMGLVRGKKYTSVEGLRYGKISLLVDADVDGSHIKGLIMSYIHHYWPSLLKIDGFIECLTTPIVKLTKGKGAKQQSICFYNLNEFEIWKEKNNDGKGWTPMYYKGLGTNGNEEARLYFTDYNDKTIKYCWKKEIDENDNVDTIEKYEPKGNDICEDAITLAFAKKRENDRKEWMNLYNPDLFIDNKRKKISYAEFVHKELIAFSVYNVARAVPNIMDGFKPSQRKIYFGCVKKNIYTTNQKVAQLSGYIAEHSAYHHGEVSLQEAIIGMAQTFVGSNNLNLLVPIGQFGTRLCGGDDSASPRYIFTLLSEISKTIFNDHDSHILKYNDDDGKKIEPQFYVPVVPMILINGVVGIGTGYSTTIPPCNPRDVYDNLRRINDGLKPKPMTPWYRNFRGTVEKIDKTTFIIRAKYEVVDDETIKITDLPIGVWTDNYKSFLDNIILGTTKGKKGAAKETETETATAKAPAKKGAAAKGGSKTAKAPAKRAGKNSKKSATAKVAKSNKISQYVKTFTEDCTNVRVSFTIKFYPGKLNELIKSGKLEKDLKLQKTVKLTNMHLFDDEGKVIKYSNYGAILNNFARVRLEHYQKRKDHLLGKWRHECNLLKWKMKFIDDVINGTIVVFKKNQTKKKEEIKNRLIELEYPRFVWGNKATEEGEKENDKASYNYITTMGLFELTTEQVEKLRQALLNKEEDIQALEAKSTNEMWDEELTTFMKAYDKWEKASIAEYEKEMVDNSKKNKRRVGKKAA